MHAPGAPVHEALAALGETYGPIDLRGEPFLFDHSDYYEPEMGAGLLKFLVSFAEPVPAERLPEIKLATNAVESRFTDGRGGRLINLDPGLVSLSNVVLATTKGHAHRLYLGRGIWGEVTLVFRGRAFEPLTWTYPDYRTPAVLDFLREVRTRLRARGAGSTA
jgi:hypothetical protein